MLANKVRPHFSYAAVFAARLLFSRASADWLAKVARKKG
jgi:hypothetical protein